MSEEAASQALVKVAPTAGAITVRGIPERTVLSFTAFSARYLSDRG